MKRLLILPAILMAFASCRPTVTSDWEPILFVQQIADDTSGVFSLVTSYRNAGTKGSIALIGEPESCLQLAQRFLEADERDNVDGRLSHDRLPDFAGERFSVILDEHNAPYSRYVQSSSDSLREIAVRNAVAAVDSVCFSDAMIPSSRLVKNRAKVFVLASPYLSEFGLSDIDTLFKIGGHEPLIISQAEALMEEANERKLNHFAVWAPANTAKIYERVSRQVCGKSVVVLSPDENRDDRMQFREAMRQYHSLHPNQPLDAILLDPYDLDTAELEAELEHIRREITEEDASLSRLLPPSFRFIPSADCVTAACYRLFRRYNLFTHDIAYPSARYFQTEETMDGDYVFVEISPAYVAQKYAYVPDIH